MGYNMPIISTVKNLWPELGVVAYRYSAGQRQVDLLNSRTDRVTQKENKDLALSKICGRVAWF